MKIYDVLVEWYTGYHKQRLSRRVRWHRGIKATCLTEASEKALAYHTDVWSPKVAMCWTQWPQPKGLS